jgi:hypothetical protein
MVLSEPEIKAVIQLEKEQLEAVIDPVERKCVGAFIAGLECALNE